jgi:hypothetical protein
MFQQLDLKLRAYWAFWDTHGTRLVGQIAQVYFLLCAALVALMDADSKVSAALLAVGAVLGRMVQSRGMTNAASPPPPPEPGQG